MHGHTNIYLLILVHLSKRLNVSYCEKYFSVDYHASSVGNDLLQMASFKLLVKFLTYLAGIKSLYTYGPQMVPVRVSKK